MTKEDPATIRDNILKAALPDVPFDGWNWELILKAAKQSGYEEDMAKAVFPDKTNDVLDAFADLTDRQMLSALKAQNPEDMRIRDRIREAVTQRLITLEPNKEALRHSLQFWAIPFRQFRAAKIVWRTADRIWNWAGDTSEDYNHYTKRTLLSGILTSTTLIWLNDHDKDMRKTLEFLDRRIENVLKIGGCIGKIKSKFAKEPKGEAA